MFDTQDYFGTSKKRPLEDTIQNWDFISYDRSGSDTTLVFSRAFDTGDSAQDVAIRVRGYTYNIGKNSLIMFAKYLNLP